MADGRPGEGLRSCCPVRRTHGRGLPTVSAGTSVRQLRRITPVALRLTALALRSALVFLLARYLQVPDVGMYGLMTVMIAYAIYPLGFDFYTYSTREILRGGRRSWPTFLRSQLAFAVVLYAVVCPLLLLLFVSGLMPWSVAIWFYCLIPLEHLGLELDRILIAMGDQVGASVGLLVRQAFMPLVVIPLMALIPQTRTLDMVFAGWVLFDLIGVTVGLILVKRQLSGAPEGAVDYRWIRRGILMSVPFLVGTLCLRALFTADRQVIQLAAGLEVLAAYTLFMSVGNGMTSVIYAGVHQFSYPQLVTAAHEHNARGYRSALVKMLVRTTVIIVGIAAVAIAILPLLLAFVGHETYTVYAWMLPWIMLVTGLYNLSLVPHYVLYSLDADRTILWLTVGALAAFCVIVATLASQFPVGAVLGGLMVASLVMLVGKSIAAGMRLRHLLVSWDG